MKNPILEQIETGIKIAVRNSNNFRYADDAGSNKDLRNLSFRLKRESAKPLCCSKKPMSSHQHYVNKANLMQKSKKVK